MIKKKLPLKDLKRMKNIEPVIKFYKQSNLLTVVNGEKPIIEISNEISDLIEGFKVDFEILDNINTQENNYH